MAHAPIHLAIPSVTPAFLLAAMLDTCRTSETIEVWNQDFIENMHLISYADRMDLVAKSAARRGQIGGVQ
ncbi:hypothetical protein U5A82_17445 [Sphingobium sp. CR2-8]|uniref:hypothetical protein n=1 Tax=Sphingobium sp. CR2-8 TaxID=1306534 RepID=UPI002DB99AFE|nr:hypothetical protein [Sphingobium sp. CR2-8]MEC3912194.1 hypothetical protein [Sphingobium sp. CR2-8]